MVGGSRFTGSPVGPSALTLPRPSLSYCYGLNCVPPIPANSCVETQSPLQSYLEMGRGVGHETGALKKGLVPLEGEA